MAWLTHEQIVELLADCKRQDPILALVVKICLSTGARWREAVNLTRSQVTKYRITFVRTKGKKTEASLSVKSFTKRSWRLMGSISSQTAIFNFYPWWKKRLSCSLAVNSHTFCAIRLRRTSWCRVETFWPYKNSRTPRYKNDYALRTSGTGSSGNGAPFQSSGNAAKWRQSGGSGWHYPVITTTDHQPNLLFLI